MADDALTPEQRAEMIWLAECAIPGWGVKVEALLDRLEAAEARVRELADRLADHCWEGCPDCPDLFDGAVAGEPEEVPDV